MDDVEPRLARVALACLLEPGTRALHELIAERGPGGALIGIMEGNADPVLVDAARSRLALGDPRHAAINLLHRTHRLGARVVVPEDTEWPSQLADLGRISRGDGNRIDRDTYPPTCLWVRGEPPLTEAMERSVAIVGARASTSYGTHTAIELAYGLASRGWTVVSGGAYGIDASAHRGALSASGTTAAVLACGVDRPYPAGHSSLFERISDDGLLVSEWPLGADPHRYRFLVRNRVIAALTRGTVMVEANARSGARQTLGRAALLRRATLVVPGPVGSAMSVGCHQAIRTGALLVTSYQEVLEEVGRIGEDLAPLPQGPEDPRDRLGTELTRVLDAVPYRQGADAAQVAAVAGVPLREVLRALPHLQTAGFVEERNGLWTGVRTRVGGQQTSRSQHAADGEGQQTAMPGNQQTARAGNQPIAEAEGQAQAKNQARAGSQAQAEDQEKAGSQAQAEDQEKAGSQAQAEDQEKAGSQAEPKEQAEAGSGQAARAGRQPAARAGRRPADKGAPA